MMSAEQNVPVVGIPSNYRFERLPSPVSYNLRLKESARLVANGDEVFIEAGTVIRVELSTGDSVRVMVPTGRANSVLSFKMSQVELHSAFHKITESE